MQQAIGAGNKFIAAGVFSQQPRAKHRLSGSNKILSAVR
jgi:hypothetical protein